MHSLLAGWKNCEQIEHTCARNPSDNWTRQLWKVVARICIGQIRDAACRRDGSRGWAAAGNQCSVTAAWQNSSWHTKILLMAGHFTVLPHTHRYNDSNADLLNVESVGARSWVKIVNTTKHCTFYALSMGTCSSKLLTWKMLVNIFLSFDFTFTHTHTQTFTHGNTVLNTVNLR